MYLEAAWVSTIYFAIVAIYAPMIYTAQYIMFWICADPLKVPKHDNFSITFFALSEPIWVCDVGTAKKIEFFYRLTPDFDGFGFFAAY